MTVNVGNLVYFITLLVFIIFTVLVGSILKKTNEKTQKIVLISIAFINLAVHFLKLLIPQYRESLPTSFRKVTFENICATTTIMMPFVMLLKNKVMKDYIFYIGVLGGLAAIVYPAEAIGKEINDLDVIRFYICHMILFIVPFYTVLFGIHKLSLKRVILFPLTFFIVEYLILANEIVLMEAGFVDFRADNFLEYNYRNSNFIFGPTDYLKPISDKIIDPLVPDVFKTVGDGQYAGEFKYIPVLWLVVPGLIYLTIIGAILCLLMNKISKKETFNFN